MNILNLLSETIEPEITYVYKQPFRIEWSLIVMALPLAALAYHFYRQGCKYREMKRECTIEVSAVISALRKSRSIDGHFGRRGLHYNADYQYEYDGKTYESHNSIYGQMHYTRPKVGDTVTIRINPFAPTELFDPLAESGMRFFFSSSVIMAISVGMLTFGQVIMQII